MAEPAVVEPDETPEEKPAQGAPAERSEQIRRLAAATQDLAAAIAVTEQLAASRAELLRTVNATSGTSRSRNGDGRIVSLTEAARRSGRNPEVLRRWCLDGRIPAIRVGRTWALTEETVTLLVAHRARARPRLGAKK